jgi:hypothetical protein
MAILLGIFTFLFSVNGGWGGLSFTENGGYEAIAPIVFLTITWIVRIINNGWVFAENDLRRNLPYLNVVFLIDLSMRFSNMPSINLDSLLFDFKYGGIFPTSNVAGYLACVCLVWSIILKEKKQVVIWSLLILFTSSRTSITAATVALLSIRFGGGFRRIEIMTLAAVVGILVVYVTNINWSLESKFLILERFSEIFEEASNRERTFGLEGGRIAVWERLDIEADGVLISPHNPFIKVGLYYGLIGELAFLYYLSSIQKQLRFIYLMHCFSGVAPFLSILSFGIKATIEDREPHSKLVLALSRNRGYRYDPVRG